MRGHATVWKPPSGLKTSPRSLWQIDLILGQAQPSGINALR